MKNFVLSPVIVTCASIVCIANVNPLPAKDLPTPALEARLVVVKEGIMIEVLTQEKLIQPQLQHFVGQWVPFHEPKDLGGKYLYRARSYYNLSENVVLSLKFQAPQEDKVLMTSLVVPQFKTEAAGPVALDVRSTEQFAKGQEPAANAADATGDIGLAIINRYRAERGLAPIQYDPAFANVSRINNEMGGGHRYNTGWQTWASPADPEAAVAMWMGPYYGSHGVIIMNPSITRGGTHSHPGSGTTFTGN